MRAISSSADGSPGNRCGARVAHAVPRRNPGPPQGLRDCRNAARQQPVMTRDASRFQPASDTPHSDHAGSSHRTGCWRRSCAFNASTVSAAVAARCRRSGRRTNAARPRHDRRRARCSRRTTTASTQRHPGQGRPAADHRRDERDHDRRAPRPALQEAQLARREPAPILRQQRRRRARRRSPPGQTRETRGSVASCLS